MCYNTFLSEILLIKWCSFAWKIKPLNQFLDNTWYRAKTFEKLNLGMIFFFFERLNLGIICCFTWDMFFHCMLLAERGAKLIWEKSCCISLKFRNRTQLSSLELNANIGYNLMLVYIAWTELRLIGYVNLVFPQVWLLNSLQLRDRRRISLLLSLHTELSTPLSSGL